MVFKPQLLWWNVCKTWNIRFLFHWWINRKHPLPWWFPNFHIFYNSFQKFLFIFLPIRTGWSKWVLGQSKPPVPASWSSRIEGTKRWLFLISAAPPWCWFGEAGWLNNAGISLAGGIPSTSVTTWGLLLPSSARTPGAGMFVPAPVSKAAPALKEELTNGHCDGVAHGTVFCQHPERTESPKQPKVPPRCRDVIFSRPFVSLARPRDERRGFCPIGFEKSGAAPALGSSLGKLNAPRVSVAADFEGGLRVRGDREAS